MGKWKIRAGFSHFPSLNLRDFFSKNDPPILSTSQLKGFPYKKCSSYPFNLSIKGFLYSTSQLKGYLYQKCSSYPFNLPIKGISSIKCSLYSFNLPIKRIYFFKMLVIFFKPPNLRDFLTFQSPS